MDGYFYFILRIKNKYHNMKTTLKNTSMCIEKLLFNQPGKITITMGDGRLFIIPLKYFPELQKLSVEKRKKYTIVNDKTILFVHTDAVYHLEDFIGLEEKWKER
jgi:hypothetical protein